MTVSISYCHESFMRLLFHASTPATTMARGMFSGCPSVHTYVQLVPFLWTFLQMFLTLEITTWLVCGGKHPQDGDSSFSLEFLFSALSLFLLLSCSCFLSLPPLLLSPPSTDSLTSPWSLALQLTWSLGIAQMPCYSGFTPHPLVYMYSCVLRNCTC